VGVVTTAEGCFSKTADEGADITKEALELLSASSVFRTQVFRISLHILLGSKKNEIRITIPHTKNSACTHFAKASSAGGMLRSKHLMT
jgi:hypothetical protein